MPIPIGTIGLPLSLSMVNCQSLSEFEFVFSDKWRKHSNGRGRRSLGHRNGSGRWMDSCPTDPSYEYRSDAGRIRSLHLHRSHRNVFNPTSRMRKKIKNLCFEWHLWRTCKLSFFVFVQRHKHFELIPKPIFALRFIIWEWMFKRELEIIVCFFS